MQGSTRRRLTVNYVISLIYLCSILQRYKLFYFRCNFDSHLGSFSSRKQKEQTNQPIGEWMDPLWSKSKWTIQPASKPIDPRITFDKPLSRRSSLKSTRSPSVVVAHQHRYLPESYCTLVLAMTAQLLRQ